LFISIRIAASVAQLLQLSSVPVGAAIWRLLSRLECMRAFYSVRPEPVEGLSFWPL
jgi:hypothetical protein